MTRSTPVADARTEMLHVAPFANVTARGQRATCSNPSIFVARTSG